MQLAPALRLQICQGQRGFHTEFLGCKIRVGEGCVCCVCVCVYVCVCVCQRERERERERQRKRENGRHESIRPSHVQRTVQVTLAGASGVAGRLGDGVGCTMV